MHNRLLIKNTTLYDNIQDAAGYDILVANGKIVSIVPTGGISEPVSVIDASGLIAIPGLIDIHIHGAGGADSLEGTKESLTTISRTLAKLGTTAFLSAMVVRPGEKNRHLQAAGEFKGKISGGAELTGVYIEGPFINTEKRGGIIPECIAGPSLAVLEKILEEAGDALRIMCVAPEIPGNDKIIHRLKEMDITVAFGHSDAGYEETKSGFDMGISHITHLFNAMRPLHHRRPGPLAAIFENGDITVELIGDSHHVHPSLVSMAWKLAGNRNIISITDGISGMGLPEGTYTYNKKQYMSKDGLARYPDGTLIGSTMSLCNIARNFMTFAGVGLKEAIDTVTINPARILGIDSIKGSLESGKEADIVLIDRLFNVQYTIIDGKTVYKNHN